MAVFNEYSKIEEIAIRDSQASFVNQEKLSQEWKNLRFHAEPDLMKQLPNIMYLKSY